MSSIISDMDPDTAQLILPELGHMTGELGKA